MLKHTEDELIAALEHNYNCGPKRAIADYVVNDTFSCMQCSPDERTRYRFVKNSGRVVCSRYDLIHYSLYNIDDWHHAFIENLVYPDTIEQYFQVSTIENVLLSPQTFEYILSLLENK